MVGLCCTCKRSDICKHQDTLWFVIEKYYKNAELDIDITRCEYYEKEEESPKEKLATIVTIMKKMERDTGMIDKFDLLANLLAEHGMNNEESEKYLSSLNKTGTIYEPRKGCLKLT